jgi:hypothetical protein
VVEKRIKMEENEINDAKLFIDALAWAKQHGLEIEFFNFFLADIKRGASVEDAIWYANCEWDL